MSKKINMSQAVRDYMAANPDDKPKAIVEGLSKKNIKVSVGLVNAVRSKTPKKASKKAINGHSDKITIASLLEAKTFVTRAGSIESAKRALDTLAKLAT